MLPRFHKVLIALLVVQLALAIVMLTRSDESAARKAVPLLPGFDAANVTKLAVFCKDGTTPGLGHPRPYTTDNKNQRENEGHSISEPVSALVRVLWHRLK